MALMNMRVWLNGLETYIIGNKISGLQIGVVLANFDTTWGDA